MRFARVPFTALLAASVIAATPSPGTSPPVAGVAPLVVTVAEMRLVAVGYRASKIIGSHVTNDQNQDIGRVTDFVVTPNEYVSFIIVSVGGFLGIGAKEVAVPAKRFKGLGTSKIVLPGATKQALEALPPFVPTQ